MNRRALLATVGSLAWRATARRGAAAVRPHILHVVLDDARARDMAESLPLTRAALDGRLAEYPNHFFATPLCGPSRASIMTGQHARRHGFLANESKFGGGMSVWRSRRLSQRSIAVALHEAGYRTGHFGKFINGYTRGRLAGFETQRTFDSDTYLTPSFTVNHETGRREHVRDAEEWIDDYVGRVTQEFIATADDRPWYAYVNFRSPHAPGNWAARFDGMATDLARERTPSFREALCGAPKLIAAQTREYRWTEAEYDREEQGRRRMLAGVDQQLAAVIQMLADRGELDRVLIIIGSDNGWSAGDHRWRRKSLAYAGVARVPLLLAGPGVAPGQHAALVSTIDHAPTIAAAAGVPFPEVDGLDMLGGHQRDALLIENHLNSGHPDRPRYSAVRTLDALYVKWAGGLEELHHYPEGPGQPERENLLARCATSDYSSAQLDALRQRRRDLVAATPTAKPLGTRRRDRKRKRQ